MMHTNNQCQQSNFCLKTGFLLSLIMLLDKQRSGYDQWRYYAPTNHRKAINTTASTKALMVQNRYQE